jgi:hypothetical protein
MNWNSTEKPFPHHLPFILHGALVRAGSELITQTYNLDSTKLIN